MTAPYGVTLTGFNRKRLTDTQASLAAAQAPIFGVDPATVAAGGWPLPTDIIAQLNNAFAQEMDEAWGALEAVWQSADPDQADGVSLDQLLAQNLITRLVAQKTAVQALITGTEGSLVPAGTQYQIPATGALFAANADTTIARAAVLAATLKVNTVVNSTLYSTTINGVVHSFTSAGSGATAINIAAGLVAALAAQTVATVVDNGDGTYSLETADLATPFSFDIDARQAVNSLGSPQACSAILTGPTPCHTGTLTAISTPVSGLTAVTNLQDGVLGRDQETSMAARVRRQLTLARGGKGTPDSILSKLLSGDVPGVTAANILNNITDFTDANGLPPHSFSAVVVGGTDLQVAQAIWGQNPSGIPTYGNENADGTQAGGLGTGITIIDAQGFSQVVHFSRPVKKYAWISVTLHLYSEEKFPDGGAALVAGSILDLGETWSVGEDFLLQRFYAPCMTTGVARADITIALTNAPTDSPSYGTADLAVGAMAIAVFDSSRILVTVA